MIWKCVCGLYFLIFLFFFFLFSPFCDLRYFGPSKSFNLNVAGTFVMVCHVVLYNHPSESFLSLFQGCELKTFFEFRNIYIYHTWCLVCVRYYSYSFCNFAYAYEDVNVLRINSQIIFVSFSVLWTFSFNWFVFRTVHIKSRGHKFYGLVNPYPASNDLNVCSSRLLNMFLQTICTHIRMLLWSILIRVRIVWSCLNRT